MRGRRAAAAAQRRYEVASKMKPATFSRGDQIYKKGDEATFFYVIEDGRVMLRIEQEEQGCAAEKRILRSSQFFGDDPKVR